jgi:hypothetical protein
MQATEITLRRPDVQLPADEVLPFYASSTQLGIGELEDIIFCLIDEVIRLRRDMLAVTEGCDRPECECACRGCH